MKKFLSILLCLSLIFALSATAFAAENGVSQSSASIYASKSEKDSLFAAAKSTDSIFGKSLNEYKISLDENTIMPIYYASLFDYAKSGKLEYEAYVLDGKQLYASDALNSSGKFAGAVVFSEDDVLMYKESSDTNDSVDFLTANSKRISSLTGSKITALESNTKFMFLEGAGYVYYIENGNSAVIVAANLKGTNGDLFTDENGGMVAVDDDLLTFAKELLENKEREDAMLSNLAPGENPPTGAAVPAFFADNADYNNASAEVLPQILLAAALGFAVIFLFIGKAGKAKK